MTLTGLAIAHLRASPLTSALNVALLALGTASIVVLLLLAHQISNTLTRDAEGIDLVLGAKGSPVQLVLSAVYHADIPTGNIPLDEAQRWAADSRVAQGIPLSLGDSVRGFRIVGTTAAYAELYGAEPAQGRLWDAPLEAVLGARVADATGLGVGDTFVGAHGLSGQGDLHGDSKYRVVGVLGGTGAVVDRLVLTSLKSVWAIHDAGGHDHGHAAADADDGHAHDEDHEGDHGHDHSGDKDDHAHDHADDHDHHDHEGQREDEHDEDHGDHHDEHAHAGDITAMLLQYNTPLAATSLPRQINRESNLAAAAPAFELARLLQVIGLGLDALRVFAAILIITAAFSIFGALYGALNHRRGDLAMMRCLGATRGTLMASLLIEGLLLAAAGALLGAVAGHVIVEFIGQALASARGVQLTGWMVLPAEFALLAGLLVVGLLAATLPAWQAQRTDVSTTLSQQS